MSRCRLLPYAVADGPSNMAADEVLLETAAAGLASLRLYGWSEPTVSLGYFQSESLRQLDSKLAQLSYVRRPTGGATLVHHKELTYTLALPAGEPWQGQESWLRRMHRVLGMALSELGVSARPHEAVPDEHFPGFLCFHHFSAGDLMIGAAKVAGSAQRKQRRALLQHGALLLAASPHAPTLHGIRELTGRLLLAEETLKAVVGVFERETGWKLTPSDWTANERRRRDVLVREKYTQPAWNLKR
jgi:lipoate-protein ligase A